MVWIAKQLKMVWTSFSILNYRSSTPWYYLTGHDFGNLLWDMMLLCVFIVQHSAMKRLHLTERLQVNIRKRKLNSLCRQNTGLAYLERSLYVGSTNICLLFLINFWSTSSSLLWQLDYDTRSSKKCGQKFR